MAVLVRIAATGLDGVTYDQMAPALHPLSKGQPASSRMSPIEFRVDLPSAKSGAPAPNEKPGATDWLYPTCRIQAPCSRSTSNSTASLTLVDIAQTQNGPARPLRVQSD